jgi:hypothetical protein
MNQEHYIYGETFSSEAPEPTPVAYEALSHYLASGGDDVEGREALNDIYKALSSSDPEAMLALDRLEQEGTISKDDNLILSVLLAVSKKLGPDLGFLRGMIVEGIPINEKGEVLNLDPEIASYIERIAPQLERRSERI